MASRLSARVRLRFVAPSRRAPGAQLPVPALAGPGFVFAYFWYVKAGDNTPTALTLLIGGLAAGLPAGVVLTAVMSILLWASLRLARVTVRFRNLFAVLAWSTVPVLLGVVFLLPLEVFSFGRYFCSLNPPPWLLKPVSYYTFVGLGYAVGACTFALAVVGVKELLDSRWTVSAAIVSAKRGILLVAAGIAKYLLAAPAG